MASRRKTTSGRDTAGGGSARPGMTASARAREERGRGRRAASGRGEGEILRA
jgi:hypothetical protein